MRYLKPLIERLAGLKKKMVFISGPRQVGKTTLAKSFLTKESSYFNWDIEEDRNIILKEPGRFWQRGGQAPSRVVLDEIHKYPRWKRFLKGFYDDVGKKLEILVTGSGRLDIYQKGGDSLLGRYGLAHLHPFSVGEFIRSDRLSVYPPEEAISRIIASPSSSENREAYHLIKRFSGFPEPLFSANEQDWILWRRRHRDFVIREDLRDLTRIREIGLIDQLTSLLPERIGSPLSINALREDLSVSFGAVKGWLSALERLYFLFEIRPYAGRLARTLRREGKNYLFEGTLIEDAGARFENLMALHLKKACDAWSDWGFGDFDLHYIRDKEKREVDFLVTDGRKPYLMVECKAGDNTPSSHLAYFSERLKPKHFFQVIESFPRQLVQDSSTGVTLCAADRFLAHLP
ncbi:MAG: ATP-binding protein [Deltaproteobacteria bacterium]|nr:ATP-binding protein [Deltaproteobacteria bacterium]